MMPEIDKPNQNETARSGTHRRRSFRIALAGFVLLLVFAWLFPAIGKLRAAGERRRCVENLRQLVSAWNLHLQSASLPTNFLSISNFAPNARLFVCPADKSRRKVNTWPELLEKGSSYKNGNVPNEKVRVFDQAVNYIVVHCPIHHNAALMDGSVHMVSPEVITNWLQSPLGGK